MPALDTPACMRRLWLQLNREVAERKPEWPVARNRATMRQRNGARRWFCTVPRNCKTYRDILWRRCIDAQNPHINDDLELCLDFAIEHMMFGVLNVILEIFVANNLRAASAGDSVMRLFRTFTRNYSKMFIATLTEKFVNPGIPPSLLLQITNQMLCFATPQHLMELTEYIVSNTFIGRLNSGIRKRVIKHGVIMMSITEKLLPYLGPIDTGEPFLRAWRAHRYVFAGLILQRTTSSAIVQLLSTDLCLIVHSGTAFVQNPLNAQAIANIKRVFLRVLTELSTIDSRIDTNVDRFFRVSNSNSWKRRPINDAASLELPPPLNLCAKLSTPPSLLSQCATVVLDQISRSIYLNTNSLPLSLIDFLHQQPTTADD